MHPDSDERLWTSAEVLQVLAGLACATEALPWPLRWIMKPWNAALVAAGVAIGGEDTLEQHMRDGLVDSLLDEIGG